MKIALDLDGVCFNFTEALHTYAVDRRLIDPSVTKVASSWDWFQNEWGWEPGEFAEHISDAIEFWDLYARPGYIYPGVAEGVGELRRRGHQIHVITDRARFGPPGLAAGQTLQWLAEEGVEFDSVTFARHKGEVLKADIAFDDAPHHFTAYRDAGVLCVMREHPYNVGIGTIRVPAFPSFIQLVESLHFPTSTLRALEGAPEQRSAS